MSETELFLPTIITVVSYQQTFFSVIRVISRELGIFLMLIYCIFTLIY